MPKCSVIKRQEKRARTVERYKAKRLQLKLLINNRSLAPEERELAQRKLQLLPRDANPVRLRNRCARTGRPRGVYRKFRLGRNKLRELAMLGEIPGLKKASW